MAKARPSSTDIDRFLEEVNRRKQQQAKQNTTPAQPPVQRASPKPAAPPPPPKPVRVQQKQVVMAEPVSRAAVIESMPQATALHEYVPKESYQPSAAMAATIPVRQLDSHAVQQARQLMKTKEGLRAILVMNEILAPPRCKRPFRR
jgi:hypothetical protein